MKKFDIQILTESWIWTKVGEVLETASGGTPSRRIVEYYNGKIPWVKSGELDFNILRDTEEKITEEAIKNSSTKIFPKGTLLIALYGATVGKLAFLGVDAATNQAVCGIFEHENINLRFIYYYLLFKKSYLISKSAGGAQPNISQNIIKNLDIPFCPLPEQHRIVSKLDELFSELEKGIEQLELVQQKLKVYRQALLKSAFEGKLTEKWRKQQTNLKNPQQLIDEINQFRKEKYKKELKNYEDGNVKIKPNKPEKLDFFDNSITNNLSELPENWCWVQLENVCEKAQKIKKDEIISDESFLYIDIGAIDNNLNRIVSCKEYLWKDAPSRAQQIIQFNDILFSTVRTYLKNIAKVKDEKYNNQIGSTGFTVIRAIQTVLNPDYLFKYILSDLFINPLNELQTGSSYPAVRDSDVFAQYIPLCSIDEQIEIVNLLEGKFSVIDNLSVSTENKIRSSESLRQSILQKAFSGQLVPQDPNDEPANVLLERIKKEREEYLKKQAKEKKTIIRKTKISMAEELKTIMQLLHESKKPIAAKSLWQASVHKENIDAFYAELKTLIESGEIKEAERKGKDSFLTLANAK